MLYVKIPKDRVGVLVGPNGEVKHQIEKSCMVELKIDSSSGDVTVIPTEEGSKDGLVGLSARDIVKAIARGFSPERAMKLVSEDMFLEVIDIRDFAGKDRKHIARVRARLIGTDGKTRNTIEEFSGAELSIYGNTVAIIADLLSMDAAKRAVEMLLEGSEHSAVYRFLENKRRYLKYREMAME
ncbi:MAG: KH domain-containing protein [Thermoplasmata archaeon]